MRVWVLGWSLLLNACGVMVAVGDEPFTELQALLAPERSISAVTVGRNLHCGTPGEGMQTQLLPDAAAVNAWQLQRAVRLLNEAPQDVPHVLVELGARTTTGYGIAVSQRAGRKSGTLVLRASIFTPASGQAVKQEPMAPCVLLRLPRYEWDAVKVYDQADQLRAQYPQLAS